MLFLHALIFCLLTSVVSAKNWLHIEGVEHHAGDYYYYQIIPSASIDFHFFTSSHTSQGTNVEHPEVAIRINLNLSGCITFGHYLTSRPGQPDPQWETVDLGHPNQLRFLSNSGWRLMP